jgi:hypothetical protein
MRSRIQKALVIGAGALAIAVISQSPGSPTDYVTAGQLVDVCTPNPNPEVPWACVCIDTPTCTFDIYPHYGTTPSNDIGQVCRLLPGNVKTALSSGKPTVGNPCDDFPSGG